MNKEKYYEIYAEWVKMAQAVRSELGLGQEWKIREDGTFNREKGGITGSFKPWAEYYKEHK